MYKACSHRDVLILIQLLTKDKLCYNEDSDLFYWLNSILKMA